jgi:hypothetical protein
MSIQYSLIGRLDGLQNGDGGYGEVKIVVRLPEIEP